MKRRGVFLCCVAVCLVGVVTDARADLHGNWGQGSAALVSPGRLELRAVGASSFAPLDWLEIQSRVFANALVPNLGVKLGFYDEDRRVGFATRHGLYTPGLLLELADAEDVAPLLVLSNELLATWSNRRGVMLTFRFGLTRGVGGFGLPGDDLEPVAFSVARAPAPVGLGIQGGLAARVHLSRGVYLEGLGEVHTRSRDGAAQVEHGAALSVHRRFWLARLGYRACHGPGAATVLPVADFGVAFY